MDLLKIGLIADTSKAIEGMEKTAKSVNTLGNALISGKKVAHEYGLALDQKLAEISEKVSAGLISNQKGIEQSYKLLAEQRAKMLAGMGEESKEYKTLVTYSDAYKQEIDKLNAAQEKQASTTKAVGVAQSSVDKTTKEVTRSFKEQTTYLQKLFSVAKNILMFQLLMSPIRNGLRGIKDTLRESVSVAAEAEQRFSKLATVFDGLADSAKAMAQSVAGSIGVANSTSASALSTVGDLLQAQGMGTTQSLSMSAEWVKQFQDIIAFKDINMSLEEFAQNFMSGAAGNLRNFRTFGSIVKESAVNARLAAQGLDKLTGSQLELAKMTTRANIALEQQKNAMGATEREWDTMLSINRRLNEAWKEYKENLGDTLNRIIKPMKEAITEMLDDANRATRLAEQTATHQEIMAGSRPVSVLRDALTNADDAAQFKTFINELVQKAIVPNGGRADDPGSLAGQIAGLQTTNEYIEWFQKEYATQYIRRNPGASQEAANAYGLMMAQGAFAPSIESYKTNIQNGNEDLGTESLDLTNLAKTMIEFGVSIEKLKDATDNALPDTIYENIEAYRTMITEGLTQRDRRQNLESTYNSYSAMIEAISGMKVAGTPVAGTWDFDNYNQSSEGANALLEIIANAMSGAGSDAFANIMGADLAKTWGDAVAIALDGMDKSNLLEGKANSLKTLYGIILEYMPEEADLLEKVAKAYRDTNKDLADYIASIEAQKNALSAMNNIIASAAERAGVKAYTDQGYSSEIATLMYSRDRAKSAAEANFNTLWAADGTTRDEAGFSRLDYNPFEKIVSIEGSFYSLKEMIDLATEAYDEQIKAINDAIEAERRKAYGNALGTITGGMQNYKTQLRQLGMTEDQKALDDLWHGFQKLVDSLDLTEEEIEAMNLAYDEEEKALRELQKATKEAQRAEWRKAFGNSLNPAAPYIDAYKAGKENFDFKGGGVVALLVELLKNTEAFQTLMSIIQDNVVPIMDAILKPLLPALRVLTQFMDNLPWDVFFTVFQAVSATLVIALDVISRILGTISAVVKTIYYAITFQWGKIGKVWEDFIDDQRSVTNRTETALNEIAGMVFHIERNTEKDNLAVLNDLLARGIINEQQYNAGARVVQKDMIFDPVSARDMNFIAPSAPAARTVSYGGITLNINGGNISEVRRVIYEIFAEQGISYNTAIGG